MSVIPALLQRREAGNSVPGAWQAAVLACAVGRQRPRSQLKLGEREQHFEVVLRFPKHP